MSSTTWESQLEAVLKKYLATTEAQDAVMRMYKAIRTVQQSYLGRNDAEQRTAVAQMLLDVTFVLPHHPAIIRTGNDLWGTFVTAVNNYFDALTFMSEWADKPDAGGTAEEREAKSDLFLKGISCSYSMHDIAVKAMLWDRGPAAYRTDARAFREALMAIKDS